MTPDKSTEIDVNHNIRNALDLLWCPLTPNKPTENIINHCIANELELFWCPATPENHNICNAQEHTMAHYSLRHGYTDPSKATRNSTHPDIGSSGVASAGPTRGYRRLTVAMAAGSPHIKNAVQTKACQNQRGQHCKYNFLGLVFIAFPML